VIGFEVHAFDHDGLTLRFKIRGLAASRIRRPEGDSRDRGNDQERGHDQDQHQTRRRRRHPHVCKHHSFLV
jgi:hypothetical protein